MLSRNSESSRAVPPEKRLSIVAADPFTPTFGSRVRGMGQGELHIEAQAEAVKIWRKAARQAEASASRLNELGVDKSHVNRLLEPFIYHRAIVTATTWSNFLKLRCPPGDQPDADFPAQVEFQEIALRVRAALRESEPRLLKNDEWATPLVSDEECEEISREEDRGVIPYRAALMISAARCARSSYRKHLEDETFKDSLTRATRLIKQGHWSPLEHQGSPTTSVVQSGNFLGFIQHRKLYPGESGSR